ncbi:MAG: response regulator, partial [Thermoleophilia bacterium]|nr:response regulator [Thermoleophilia bacterium]
ALARELRALRPAEELPLVLLTSLGRREAESDEALFAARLTKPIRPSQLYDALLDLLGAPPTPAAADARPAADEPATATVPLRVLIAEDNAVNRQLALLLLEKLGHRAAVAVNGREAVEAVERDRYDVVLMDVQMPEMDGLEATRAVRERFPSGGPYIIAATANALGDERDRCLAAGMDDYLSKPIRLERLAAALARVRPAVDGPADGVDGSGREAIDASVLAQLRAAVGDEATGELVETFLAEAPKVLAALRQALEAEDSDALRRGAHTLKANAATFGADALAELARELEAAGEEARLAGAAELVSRVEAEYERARAVLAAERR